MPIRYDIKTDLDGIYTSGGSLPHIGLGELLDQIVSGEVVGPGTSTPYSIVRWSDSSGMNLSNTPSATIDNLGVLTLSATNVTHSLYGALKIGNTLQSAATAGAGAIRYDSVLEVSDGTNWIVVGSSASEWHITGNAGTDPSSDYIGTSDNQDFIIRTNSLPRVTVSKTGSVLLSSNLTVSGDLTVNGSLTYVNTTNVEVTDKNIVLNKGGTDLNSKGSGITIDRTGTQGSLIFDPSVTSNWKAGLLGSEYELLSTANTTSDLTEGSNLYYTSARAQSDALVVAANRALSNLSSVAINTSLLFGTDGTSGNIGASSASRPANIYALTSINSAGSMAVGSTLTMEGSSNANITWNTDGAGDIGASNGNRPNNIWSLNSLNTLGHITVGTASSGLLSGTNVLWNKDGGGNIGAPYSNTVTGIGINRPYNIYSYNAVYTRQYESCWYSASNGDANNFYFIKGRGTETSPSPVLSGDYLGFIQWRGTFDTTIGHSHSSTQIRSQALENFTSTTTGGRLVFYTTPVGTSSLVETVSMAASGVTIETNLYFSPDNTYNIGNGNSGLNPATITAATSIVSKGSASVGSTLTMAAASSANILWSTDGSGDIGSSSTSRPNNVYVKNSIVIGSAANLYESSLNVLKTDSSLAIGGGLSLNRTSTAVSKTLSLNECYLAVDTTNSVTITLPLASNCYSGKVYIIKDEKGNATAKPVTVQTSGSDSLDGAGNFSLSTSYDSITLVTDGASNWFIV